MTLKELLTRNKSKILQRWLDLVLDTYPPETARFLKDEKDRFANPVAFTVKCNLELLLDDLLNNSSEKTVMSHLEEIINQGCAGFYAFSGRFLCVAGERSYIQRTESSVKN